MAERLLRAHRRRVAPVLIGTTIAVIALGASPALADTGSVYFDNASNAAAGETASLFNATFTGTNNVGLGRSVMPNLTSGFGNTAIGDQALNGDTTGNSNTATGRDALSANTTGGNNVATGVSALLANSTGTGNVASGPDALRSNTEGLNNVATGNRALLNNTTGDENVATGSEALLGTGTGNRNVATGVAALRNNTTGDDNVATGVAALLNSTGSANVAIGAFAGQNLTTGSNNIDIGNDGKNAGESKTIRIGTKGDQTRTFIAGINGKTVSGTGTPVVVNDKGQLGTASAVAASAAKPLSAAAGRRLVATVKRQQRQIERQGKEIRALRAQSG